MIERHCRAASLAGAVLAAMAVIVALPAPLAAQYLDPGAGSLLLQVIIAGIVTAAATIKLYWHRLKSFFSRSDRD